MQGTRVPLAINKPKLEGNRKGKQETGPGCLSVAACGMRGEDREVEPGNY